MKASRILTLLLSLVLMLALAACGAKTPEAAETVGESTEAVETAGETEEQQALRTALLAAGEGTVTLPERIAFSEPLVVSGTKTLCGGTLTADASADCLISVPSGACLILDGAALDGGGCAKAGIRVEQGGTLELRSGSIENTTRQAVRTEGKVSISGGSISGTGSNWLYCAKGSETAVSGGAFLLSDDVGITVFAGAKLNISGGSFENAGNATVFNRGTTDITGGTITASGNYALSNEADMTVKNLTVSGSLDRGDIYNFDGGSLRVEDTTLSGSASYCLFNNGEAELVRVHMEHSAASSINNQTQSAKLTVTDSTITGAGANGIYNKDAAVTLSGVTITDSENHAIYNRAGTVSADGLTMRTAKGTVVCNDSIAEGESVFGSVSLKNFTVSGAEGYGISSYGGTVTLKGGTVEKSGSYCIYIKAGTAALDGVTCKGTREAGRAAVSIGTSTFTGAKVTMSNVSISGAARGISNHGTLTLLSGTVSGNTNSGELNYGGGIYNFNVFTMNGGTITGNTAAKGGGGLCNDGKAFLNGGVISGNTASTHGGGIYNTADGTIEIHGTRIENNAAGVYTEPRTVTAESDGTAETDGTVTAALVHADEAEGPTSSGGGLYNLGTATVSDGASVTGNTAAKNGGGIYNSRLLTLSGGSLTGNKAGENGGGLYFGSAAQGTITDCTVDGNTANQNGAGLYLLGEATLSGGSFTGNTAFKNGAGIYVTSKARLTAADSSFTGNSAEKGGGIYLYHNETAALLQNLTMSGNRANGNGTAVYSASGSVHFVGGSYSGSGAEGEGYTVHSYQAEGEAVPVYQAEGALKVDSLYVTAEGTVALTGKLTEEASLGIRLNTTKDISKRTIVTGEAETVKESAAALSVINQSDNYTYKVKEDGMGSSLAVGKSGTSGESSSSGSSSGSSSHRKKTTYVAQIGETKYATLAAAIAAAEDGGTVTLIANTSVSSPITVAKAVTLESDGSHTVSLNCSKAVTVDQNGRLSVVGTESAPVTFTSATRFDSAAFYVNEGAQKLALTNVIIDGIHTTKYNGAAIFTKAPVALTGVEIRDCSTATDGAALYIASAGTATLTDCNFHDNSAEKGGDIYDNGSLSVSGNMSISDLYLSGKTLGIDAALAETADIKATLKTAPAAGVQVLSTTEAETSTLAVLASSAERVTVVGGEGMVIEIDGCLYSGNAAAIGEAEPTEYATLDAALAAAQDGESVTLLRDAVLGASHTVDKTLTVDGGGHTVTVLAAKAFSVTEGGSLTLENLTVDGKDKEMDAAPLYCKDGTLTLNAVTVKNCSNTGESSYGGGLYANNASLTMSNCTLTGNSAAKSTGEDAYLTNGTAVTLSGTVTVGNLGLGTDTSLTLDSGFSAEASVKLAFVASFWATAKEGATQVLSGDGLGADTCACFTVTNDSQYVLNASGYVATAPAASLSYTGCESAESYDTLAAALSAMTDTYKDEENLTVTVLRDCTLEESIEFGSTVSACTVDGGGHTVTVSKAQSFKVTTGGSLSIKNLTVDGGGKEVSGAVLYNKGGTLTLDTVTVKNCTNKSTTYGGGAIYITKDGTTGGTLNATSCTFTGCTSAEKGGGAIAVAGSCSAVLTNCTFTGCTSATAAGGALSFASASAGTVTNCTFTGNDASKSNGGAIYADRAALTLSGCTATGNTSKNTGSDIYLKGGTNTVTGTLTAGEIGFSTDTALTLDSGFSTASSAALSFITNAWEKVKPEATSPKAVLTGDGLSADTCTCFTVNGHEGYVLGADGRLAAVPSAAAMLLQELAPESAALPEAPVTGAETAPAAQETSPAPEQESDPAPSGAESPEVTQ